MNFDQLLEYRQTVRQFDTEKNVPKELLEAVVEAGRQAPFAGAAQAGVDSFRHFFLIRRSSPLVEQIYALIRQTQMEEAKLLEDPAFAAQYPNFCKLLGGLVHAPADPDAVFCGEWTIVIAERRGMPVRETECLGFVQAYMGLKAAELGLGVRICSPIHGIRDSAALAKLLGLEDEYVFDGLVIGWPAAELKARPGGRALPVRSVTYFE